MILGIIPARKGSKTIKNKNIYPLCGKPLIDYTIKTALLSRLEHVVVSTDGVYSEVYHPRYIIRPMNLADDHTPMIDVVLHCLVNFEKAMKKKIDDVMLLQPTSPLRTVKDINNSLIVYKENNNSSLYSGYYIGIKHRDKVFDKNKSLLHFQRNGAIFIARRELIVEKKKLWDDDVIEFEMPKSRSVDIDDPEDMFIAESLIKNGVI